MITLRETLLVVAGGGLGSVLRFGAAVALPKTATSGFPVAILLVNVAGCALLGWLAGYVARQSEPQHAISAFVGIGICGGFTTFSTFAIDALELLREGRTAHAAIYVTASVLLGILAAAAGVALAR